MVKQQKYNLHDLYDAKIDDVAEKVHRYSLSQGFEKSDPTRKPELSDRSIARDIIVDAFTRAAEQVFDGPNDPRTRHIVSLNTRVCGDGYFTNVFDLNASGRKAVYRQALKILDDRKCVDYYFNANERADDLAEAARFRAALTATRKEAPSLG